MLTPAERAQKLIYLKEAEAALHTVSIGGSVRVFVDQTGERVEYGPTNVTALNKYIYQLKVQLGLTNVAGPVQPWM